MIRNDGVYTVADFEFSIKVDSRFQLQLYDLGMEYISKLYEVLDINKISHPNIGYTVFKTEDFINQKNEIHKKYIFNLENVNNLSKLQEDIIQENYRALKLNTLPSRNNVGLLMAMTSYNWLFNFNSLNNQLGSLIDEKKMRYIQRKKKYFIIPAMIPHFILWKIAIMHYSKQQITDEILKKYAFLYESLHTFKAEIFSRKELINILSNYKTKYKNNIVSDIAMNNVVYKVFCTYEKRQKVLNDIWKKEDFTQEEKKIVIAYLKLLALVTDEEEVRHILQMRLQYLLFKNLGYSRLSNRYKVECDDGWSGMIRSLQF